MLWRHTREDTECSQFNMEDGVLQQGELIWHIADMGLLRDVGMEKEDLGLMTSTFWEVWKLDCLWRLNMAQRLVCFLDMKQKEKGLRLDIWCKVLIYEGPFVPPRQDFVKCVKNKRFTEITIQNICCELNNLERTNCLVLLSALQTTSYKLNSLVPLYHVPLLIGIPFD